MGWQFSNRLGTKTWTNDEYTIKFENGYYRTYKYGIKVASHNTLQEAKGQPAQGAQMLNLLFSRV